MRLFDSHAHLGAPELRSEAGAMLARAREAGVRGVIAVGAGYGLSLNAAAVAALTAANTRRVAELVDELMGHSEPPILQGGAQTMSVTCIPST